MEFGGKVAVHAITWGQNHLKAIEEASALGYKAIEPWPSFVLQYENRENELIELMEQYEMKICGLYGGASGELDRRFTNPFKRQDIIDYNVRLAAVLSKLGVEHLIFGPGGPRERSTSPEQLKEAAITINEAAARVSDYGLKACVHPHLWTELQDEEELDYLFQHCSEQVYFAPDTAHLTGAGMDPAQIIRRYRDRVAYVHLKDLTSKNAKAEDFPMLLGNEALPVFCELGLGTIAFEPVIEALIDIEYTSWMTVEIDQSTSTPLNSLTLCRDFVENVLSIPIRNLSSEVNGPANSGLGSVEVE